MCSVHPDLHSRWSSTCRHQTVRHRRGLYLAPPQRLLTHCLTASDPLCWVVEGQPGRVDFVVIFARLSLATWRQPGALNLAVFPVVCTQEISCVATHSQPTNQPTRQPASQATRQPTRQPASQPAPPANPAHPSTQTPTHPASQPANMGGGVSLKQQHENEDPFA